MRGQWVFVIVVFLTVSCSTYTVTNKNHESVSFSKIKSDYRLTDLNNYGCEKINSSVIKHILHTGTRVTEKEVHDYYSTTGCSVKGSVLLNGSNADFTFDYGGIMYFSNGIMLGCGENCCSENYPYCSFDMHNLKGFQQPSR